jgi:NapC/NirT cytochrome c family, N-terminal region
MRNFFIALTRNPISLLGSGITTASGMVIVSLFTMDLMGRGGGPYVGILAYLILPALFVLGLILIPIGIGWERRRARRAAAAGRAAPAFPVIDLNRARTRSIVLIFLVLTMVNVIVIATATYKGVEVMESTPFCGATCHTVMQPEYTAYQRSPHARVGCVDCHIGPGADWFVKSKLSGAWQVIAVTFNLYPSPIPSPIENLRPARETCEQCHWPEKFVGDRLKVITNYEDDEANTELKTVLLMRVGGVQGRESQGIHWHVDPGVRIRYRSDPSRETIYEVELTKADGTVKTFLAPAGAGAESAGDGAAGAAATDGAAAADAGWRVMDCVDCHNRPSHTFRLPEEEVDRAIVEGKIDRGLPFVHRESVRLLKVPYPSQQAARQALADGLQAFYRQQYPQLAASKAAAIRDAAAALDTIYRSNVFPSMKIGWGAYPNHIGHENSPGCFRCHDDGHKTADGKTISQDCSTCHSLLAMQEENPEILKQLEQ